MNVWIVCVWLRFIYFRERERAHTRGHTWGRGRERASSRLHADGVAQHRAPSPNPGIVT